MNDDALMLVEAALLASDTVAKREEIMEMIRKWRADGLDVSTITGKLAELADAKIAELGG